MPGNIRPLFNMNKIKPCPENGFNPCFGNNLPQVLAAVCGSYSFGFQVVCLGSSLIHTPKREDAGLWVLPTLWNGSQVGSCKARVGRISELIGCGFSLFRGGTWVSLYCMALLTKPCYHREALVWWGFVFFVCGGLRARAIPLKIVFVGETRVLD